MKQRVLDLLEGEGQGVVTSAELRRLGVGPAVLRTMLRERLIVRVARGAYVSAGRLNPPKGTVLARGRAAVVEDRHLLTLDAILRSYAGRVGASHQSAVLAWGLPVLLTTLERVHVAHVRRGATGRRHATFTIHTCEHEDAFTRHDGRKVVLPPLAVLGTASSCGLTAGLVAVDGALRSGRTTPEELTQWLDRLRHHPGLSTARAAVDLADGTAESAGETLLRLVLVRLGIRFETQHWIRTSDGHHYRVDFYLPDLGVVLEFDGLIKYARARSQDGASVSGGRNPLVEEKVREDALRADGYGVGRVVWSGLGAASVTAVVRTAAAQARDRARNRPSSPPPWWAA